MLTTLPILSMLACSAMSGAAPEINVEAIDTLLSQYVEDELYSGELLIALGDEILLHQRYGYRDWSTRAPLPERGIYKIGSVTKQFTAAAVLKLEEQGLLGTSDPIARHIPELPRALTARDGQAVTIHHLVTHTSGLPNPMYANIWGPEQGFDALLEALQGAQLRHAPGAEFHYNNTGYAILGEIVGRAAGTSFELALRRALWEPAGLRDTAIKLDQRQRAQQVLGHVSTVFSLVPSAQAFGRFVTGAYDWDLLANGNVSSSVLDLHRWVRALQEGALFTPARTAKMLTPAEHEYAYGWLEKRYEGLDEPLYWHNGAIIPFGYTADVGWTRESRLIVINLCNVDDTAVPQNLFRNVMRIIAGAPVEPPRAGLAASGSYLTIQIMALALGTSLLALLLVLYLVWLLLLRRPRSRVQLYADASVAVCSSVLVAVILQRWAGALTLALAICLTVWACWRARDLPLLHTTAWKQWLSAAGNALSGVVALLIAAFVIWYF